ncbi:MAG: FecR domain-containing protein [Prevotella sp.]|jgi:ferric-dicitrate binding protein FerR (iron transport regulator)|nr:FecR domain-containing protein [Prevotella sp.]
MENIPYGLIARYLAGECNDVEKQQVLDWSKQHPDLMDELTGLWQQIPANEFSPDVENALQKVSNRTSTTKKGNSKRLFMFVGVAAAAVAAVFILINIVGTPSRGISGNSGSEFLLTLSTGIKETKECLLPDGSKAWLNQSSEIRYPKAFTGDTREIYLEGEAFFEIASNADRPFIIHANNTQTRVVGTSFGIRAARESDEVVVTVSTGIVNLMAEGKSGHIQLHHGEQGICNTGDRKLEKSTNPDPNYLAWKTKVLVFRQSSLTEVARVIEEAYHTPVSVDNTVAGLRLTSTFDQLSLDEILQIIEITLGIKAGNSSEGIFFK